MTRKEYEKQQWKKRDARFDAAMRYRDKPHSFLGNLLRIRMAGGNMWYSRLFVMIILFFLGFGALMVYQGLYDEPMAENSLTKKTFILDSYGYNFWYMRDVRGPVLYDSQGVKYYFSDPYTVTHRDLLAACEKGAEVTVGIERTSRLHGKIRVACATVSVNGKTFLSYEDYARIFKDDRTDDIILSCLPLMLGVSLGIWYVNGICHMDNYPGPICRGFVLRQLPPTWAEVVQLEEKAYLRRHGNDRQPKKEPSQQ